MKKQYIILLISLLFITGCNKKSSRNEVLLNKYETAYNELIENDTYISNSEFFDLEVVVTKLSNQEFRVDVILDNPQLAMYNVQMMMELNSTGVAQYDEVIPSLGIVDDTQYNLIPYQSNKDNGFYSGLVLSAISKNETGNIYLMIDWTNYDSTKAFSQFVELEYNQDNVKVEEDLGDVNE